MFPKLSAVQLEGRRNGQWPWRVHARSPGLLPRCPFCPLGPTGSSHNPLLPGEPLVLPGAHVLGADPRGLSTVIHGQRISSALLPPPEAGVLDPVSHLLSFSVQSPHVHGDREQRVHRTLSPGPSLGKQHHTCSLTGLFGRAVQLGVERELGWGTWNQPLPLPLLLPFLLATLDVGPVC